jgi:hypothetical protein
MAPRALGHGYARGLPVADDAYLATQARTQARRQARSHKVVNCKV